MQDAPMIQRVVLVVGMMIAMVMLWLSMKS